LVEPVLAARSKRTAAEAHIAQQKLLEEQQLALAEERKKRQQARLIATGGISLAVLAIIALIFAVRNNQIAREAQATAQAQLHVSNANLVFAEDKEIYRALSELDSAAMLFPDKSEAVYAYLKAMQAPQVEAGRKIFYLRHALQVGVSEDTIAATSLALFKDYWGNPRTYGIAAEMAEFYATTGDSLIDWRPYMDTVRAFGAYEAAMRFLRADSLQGLAPDSIQLIAEDLLEEIGDRPWYYTKRSLTELSGQTIEAGRSYPLPEMVSVKGDTFWMGSEDGDSDETLHQVILSDYEMARYELSVGHYTAFLNAQALVPDSIARWLRLGEQIQFIEDKYQSINGQEGYPVMGISWYGAKAYTDWLRDSLGQAWELPTEAQWEFAAAGGSNGYTAEGKRRFRYAGGDTLETFAWYGGNSQGTWHPIGMLKENPLGLSDMNGNMWEWCGDWYAKDYYELCRAKGIVENPIGPEDERDYRVLRGGSWVSIDYGFRVAHRNRDVPLILGIDIGFRPARTLP
ncbi:MAG: formylglycine-generating enzyme family protein, partial [Bacteroidia bacterium]